MGHMACLSLSIEQNAVAKKCKNTRCHEKLGTVGAGFFRLGIHLK